MDKNDIIEKIRPAVSSRGCFIVELTLSRDNDIELVIESEDGTVGMEDCIAIDKAFHGIWSQDSEDYSLTVSSAGLDQPFKVSRQFEKALGSMVQLSLKGGRRLTGVLEAADEKSVTLSYSVREVPEGGKKKVEVRRTESFPMEEINAVRPHVSFE